MSFWPKAIDPITNGFACWNALGAANKLEEFFFVSEWSSSFAIESYVHYRRTFTVSDTFHD